MKTICILFITLLNVQIQQAQKNLTELTSNLNLSKSNINRIVYPISLLSPVNAALLLKEFDQTKIDEPDAMKKWLAANFKRFGVNADKVKQLDIYSFRQYEDCTICKKNCKGHCIQDPGTDCVCVHKSEPNLRSIPEQGKSGTIIYMSLNSLQDDEVIGTISSAMAVKLNSSKSN